MLKSNVISPRSKTLYDLNTRTIAVDSKQIVQSRVKKDARVLLTNYFAKKFSVHLLGWSLQN